MYIPACIYYFPITINTVKLYVGLHKFIPQQFQISLPPFNPVVRLCCAASMNEISRIHQGLCKHGLTRANKPSWRRQNEEKSGVQLDQIACTYMNTI